MLTNKSVLLGLAAYILLELAGPALKLAHVGPFAHWGWWRVTVVLWVPWVLVAVLAVANLLRPLLVKRRELPARAQYHEAAIKPIILPDLARHKIKI